MKLFLRSPLASAIFGAATLFASNADAFKTKYHEQITKTALPFIKDDIMTTIVVSNHDSDNPFGPKAGKDKFHFNDCGFRAGSRQIRELHEQVINTLREAKIAKTDDDRAAQINKASTELGTLLHIVQDFYAHSNWAESDIDILVDDAFSKTNDTIADQLFPELNAWDSSGQYVLLGPSRDDRKLSKGTKDHTVVVAQSGMKGIMTGAYNGADEPGGGSCPVEVAIGHWDEEVGGGLHKDEPTRPYFFEARKLAFKQTRREWCRLTRRMKREGLADVIAMLVKSTERSDDVCEPAAASFPTTKSQTYWNLSPRALLGFVSGAAAENRHANGIDFGARIEARYGRRGIFIGYRGDIRENSPLENWLSVGAIASSSRSMGGHYGAIRADLRPMSNTYRIGFDMGVDMRLLKWNPLFHALRLELGLGARIDSYGVRSDLRMGIAYGASFDLPY